jgi:hypothetical protein
LLNELKANVNELEWFMNEHIPHEWWVRVL